MSGERIFIDEESLTPDALAADKAAEEASVKSTKLPPFVYALTALTSRQNSGFN